MQGQAREREQGQSAMSRPTSRPTDGSTGQRASDAQLLKSAGEALSRLLVAPTLVVSVSLSDVYVGHAGGGKAGWRERRVRSRRSA